MGRHVFGRHPLEVIAGATTEVLAQRIGFKALLAREQPKLIGYYLCLLFIAEVTDFRLAELKSIEYQATVGGRVNLRRRKRGILGQALHQFGQKPWIAGVANESDVSAIGTAQSKVLRHSAGFGGDEGFKVGHAGGVVGVMEISRRHALKETRDQAGHSPMKRFT
jgi:hypothetical protein